MIELKKEFVKKGTTFKQLYKDSCMAVYRLSRPSDGNGKESYWYEVFRIIRKKADIFHKDEFEKYPYDEAFGEWAWSCSDEKSVEKILNEHFADCESYNNVMKLFR